MTNKINVSTRFAWRVVFNNGHIDVYSETPMTRDDVLQNYPDAIGIVDVPKKQFQETAKLESRRATFQERAEVVSLINDVFRDLPKADIQEAIQIALSDIDSALICFRDLKLKRDAGEMLPYLRSDPINKTKEKQNDESKSK